jgi:hypothetical protein
MSAAEFLVGSHPEGRLGVQEFGDLLLRTQDLDPVYVGLVGARAQGLSQVQLARWLLAYWCFYHVGVASYLSEQEGAEFWRLTRVAAANIAAPSSLGLPGERWPRAAERRHFRGDKCVQAVAWLREHYLEPEAPVVSLTLWNAPTTERDVMARVQRWPMFGPWIAFKAADMMERVWGLDVEFDRNIGLMYEEPRAALDLLREANPTWQDPTPENLYNRLLVYFMPHRAPPLAALRRRQVGPQELETVLCKWKSHMGGHYRVGKDIHEQRAALAGWGDTAQLILRSYPAEV